jgi:hypothetical protein
MSPTLAKRAPAGTRSNLRKIHVASKAPKNASKGSGRNGRMSPGNIRRQKIKPAAKIMVATKNPPIFQPLRNSLASLNRIDIKVDLLLRSLDRSGHLRHVPELGLVLEAGHATGRAQKNRLGQSLKALPDGDSIRWSRCAA